MRSPWILGAAILCAALGRGGALEAQPSAGRSLDELRRENVQLRREKTVAEVENARLRQIIAELEEKLQSERQKAAEASELARQAAAKAEALAAHAEAPLIETGPALESEEMSGEELGDTPDPPAPAIAELPPPPPRQVDAAGQSLYDESYTLFHEQRYREAEDGFHRFLAEYPGTDLADNAQFWIGECRYARGEFALALEAFLQTVERYPEGNKVADALFKAGKCLESTGDRAKAVATYEEVARRFPSSTAAITAQERLAELH